MSVNLMAVADAIRINGPNRVMIDENEAISSSRAFRDYGILAEVVFIRDDGWALGAPQYLEKAAEKMWEDYWVAVTRKPFRMVVTYKSVHPDYSS